MGHMKKILLIILVLIVAGAVYWFTQKGTGPEATGSPSPTATPDVTVNWPTYTNDKYGFRIKHPDGWQIKEVPTQTTLTAQLNSPDMVASKQTPIEAFVLTNQEVTTYLNRLAVIGGRKNLSESQSSLAGLAARLVRVQPKTGKQYLDTYILTQDKKTTYGLKCHDAVGDPCDYNIFNAIASTFAITR